MIYCFSCLFQIVGVHPQKTKHVQAIKHTVLVKEFSLQRQSNMQLVNLISDYIDKYDTVPTLLGAPITTEKLYFFVGYVVSGVVTIIGVLQSK